MFKTRFVNIEILKQRLPINLNPAETSVEEYEALLDTIEEEMILDMAMVIVNRSMHHNECGAV